MQAGPEMGRMSRAKSCMVKQNSTERSTGSNSSNSTATNNKEHWGFDKVVKRAMVHRSNSFSAKSSSANLNGEQYQQQQQHQQQQQRGFRLKEETKVNLKLHVIREKAISISDLLRELKQLTAECQDEIEEDLELQDRFVSKTIGVESEIKLARKLMLFLCRHRPLERHFNALSSVKEQMSPTFDISVRFFGIDWNYIFKISNCLVQLTNEIIEAFRDYADVNFDVDVVLPSNILRSLYTLEAEVCFHAEAVLRGRLSKRHQESISLEQQKHFLHPNALSSSSAVSAVQLQLLRIGTRLSAAEDLEDDDLAGKKRNGIWGAFKREIHYSRIFRNFRRSPSSQQNSDDLWRLWYLGVESVTLSVSMMTASSGRPPFLPFLPSSSAAAAASGHAATSGDRSPEISPQHQARRAPPATSTVTHREADRVLGVYSSLPMASPSPTRGARGAAWAASRRIEGVFLDETLESLELAGCAEAPRQRLDESEL